MPVSTESRIDLSYYFRKNLNIANKSSILWKGRLRDKNGKHQDPVWAICDDNNNPVQYRLHHDLPKVIIFARVTGDYYYPN